MRMRNKALLMLLGASSVFVFLMSVVLIDIVTNYFSRSEDRSATQRAQVVQAIMGADLSRLKLMAMQYGNWNDLRKFVNLNTGVSEPGFETTGFNAKDFITANFEEPRYVLREQRHGVFIADNFGNIIFADRMLDDNKTFSGPDPEMRALIAPALRQPISEAVAGVYKLTDDTLVAVGMAPILNSGGSASSRGNVAFYREYRAPAMAEFFSNLGFKFYFTRSTSLRQAEDQSVALGLRVGESAKSRKFAAGQLLKHDLGMDPSEAVQEGEVTFWSEPDAAEAPQLDQVNEPEAQAASAPALPLSSDFGFLKSIKVWLFPQYADERNFVINASLLSSIFITLAFAAMVYAIIGNWLVRPAEDLVNQIQVMIANPQAGARIKDTQTHDEFGNLTSAFNSLLSQVETQESSLRKQERLAMLGTMQAEFAHEVANPLSALVAYSRRVHEHIGEPDRLEENKRHLEKIERIGGFLTKLLNTFRSASRASATKDHWQDHDIAEILDMAGVIGNVKAKKVGVTLDVSNPQQGICIHADASQVLQIINNLISNGIDAASMKAKPGQAWVRVRCEVTAGNVVLTVADSGPGISPEIKHKLFTKFSTTKSSGAGTGLGLALSAEIIRELNGSIRLVDLASHTTFEVKIPVAQATLLSEAV